MRWYYRVGVVATVILGISTLVPAPASKPSMLGYYAHCPFAPVSTVICWVVAGVVYRLGRSRDRVAYRASSAV